jgi:hypothetical protein
MKTHLTISVDISIVEAHHKLGTNISKLCEDALRAYIQDEGAAQIKEAEEQVKFTQEAVQSSQEKAKNEEKVQELLKKAREIKEANSNTSWLHKKDYFPILKEASIIAGEPMWKIVGRL